MKPCVNVACYPETKIGCKFQVQILKHFWLLQSIYLYCQFLPSLSSPNTATPAAYITPYTIQQLKFLIIKIHTKTSLKYEKEVHIYFKWKLDEEDGTGFLFSDTLCHFPMPALSSLASFCSTHASGETKRRNQNFGTIATFEKANQFQISRYHKQTLPLPLCHVFLAWHNAIVGATSLSCHIRKLASHPGK